jgi:hypothetical protein
MACFDQALGGGRANKSGCPGNEYGFLHAWLTVQ